VTRLDDAELVAQQKVLLTFASMVALVVAAVFFGGALMWGVESIRQAAP
jgi:hypothetical protein